MKRIICFAILFIAILMLMTVYSSAEDAGYRITMRDNRYCLYKNGILMSEAESLDSLCDGLQDLGEKIEFDSVSYDGELTLPAGKYLICGSLTAGGITVPSGCSLNIDGALLSLDGPIENEGGELSVVNSAIYSKGCAIFQSYSASATLTVKNTEINSTSDTAAVIMEQGTVGILDSTISCPTGFAIRNGGSLHIGGASLIRGASMDIFSSGAIWGSLEGDPLSYSMKIQYNGEFGKGSSTPIVYSSAQGAEKLFSVFDKNGREYSTTATNTGISVYLPFTVKYYLKDKVVHSEEALNNETVAQPPLSVPEGYEIEGWYTDAECRRRYDFATSVTGDLSLFCGLRLISPTYSINEIDSIYDGRPKELGFTELTHLLGGIYLYEWYDEQGRLISTAKTVSFTEVLESGRYMCRLSFTYGTDTTVIETPYLSVRIRKATVPIPTVEDKEYTGKAQYPDIIPNGFTYEQTGFCDAGEYIIPLTLTDKNNYIWEDGSEGICQVRFRITKADNEWVDSPEVFDIYLGGELRYFATALFGTPTLEFSDLGGESFSSTQPCGIGEYLVRAVVRGTSNYHELISEPVRFKILEDKLVSFTVNTYPANSVFRSFDKFNPVGVSFLARYMSGKELVVAERDISFSYQSGECLLTSHTAVVAEYQGHFCLLPVTVLPREYEYDLKISDTRVVYNGGYITISPSGTVIEGLDGSTLSYTVVGGGTDVGEYLVELFFHTDSLEYKAPDRQVARLTVLPLELELIWSDTEFVYDGSPKVPKAYFVDVFGAKREVAASGAVSASGENYIAYAPERYLNYAFNNPQVTFTVKKADYDMSGVCWLYDSFIYSGERKTVTLSALPEGVGVIGYTNNSAINAGRYTASAHLSYDEANYNPPRVPDCEWSISPACYDISDLVILGGEYIYNGEARFPTVLGELPRGLDGSTLRCVFSRSVLNVQDSGEVTVTFVSDSVNYTAPPEITVSILIKPIGIYVTWSDNELVYNGSPQSPTASAKECPVEVIGAEADAGVYSATAHSLDSNYEILNPTHSYVIEKAENSWQNQLAVEDVFSGSPPSVNAVACFGEVNYLFYVDAELTQRIDNPTSPGRYYAVAIADAGKNYKLLVSGPVAFSVIEIVPISLSVSGREEYSAFERVSDDDLSVWLINNDGSRVALSLSELEIIYSGYDSFRFGDTELVLKYGELSAAHRVTVKKAAYDMSGVFWSGLSQEYSAEPKFPTLSGLPEGVEVIEYVGGGEIMAGVYTVSARLSFDEDNYNPPLVESVQMTIKPRGIIPECVECIYTGLPQQPTAKNPVCIPESVSYTNAGVYTVTFSLSDTDNYYLISDTAELVIRPRSVSIKISDTNSYWFDETDPISATVLEEELPLDELMLEYVITDGKITAIAKNTNYELVVEEGELTKLNRFSPRMTRVLFICLLLFVITVFGIIILILRRDELMSFCSRVYSYTVARGKPNTQPPIGDYMTVDVERADTLITDSIAKTLIHTDDAPIFTEGRKRFCINVDDLSESFDPNERVDVNILKSRGLIPSDIGYLKILGRGTLDKPLRVYANAFSLTAVKMIVLTGGEAVKVKKEK